MNKITEIFQSDSIYEPGTVVILGGSSLITQSKIVNDTKVVGVVLQTEPDTEVVVLGRAMCKVVGRVNKGDLLTTSNTPGYAVKALHPTVGAIIGKSLVDKTSGEAGTIPIMVSLI